MSATPRLRRPFETLGPECRARIGLEPQGPERRVCPARTARASKTAWFETAPSLADITPDRIHEHDRVAALQRAGLPAGDLLQHRVGDRGNQAGQRLEAIDILTMPLDLAGRQATGLQTDDLASELGKAALILGNQHRIEAAVPIAGTIQNDLTARHAHPLLASAVAPVGWRSAAISGLLGALVFEINLPLYSLCSAQVPPTPLSVRPECRSRQTGPRRTAFHQPVHKFFVNAHTWTSSSSSSPPQRTKFTIVTQSKQNAPVFIDNAEGVAGAAPVQSSKVRHRQFPLGYTPLPSVGRSCGTLINRRSGLQTLALDPVARRVLPAPVMRRVSCRPVAGERRWPSSRMLGAGRVLHPDAG